MMVKMIIKNFTDNNCNDNNIYIYICNVSSNQCLKLRKLS